MMLSNKKVLFEFKKQFSITKLYCILGVDKNGKNIFDGEIYKVNFYQ